MSRTLLSAALWCSAAGLVGLAVRVRPSVKRYEVDGATIAELPRERFLVPPAEWAPVLAAFPHEEERA